MSALPSEPSLPPALRIAPESPPADPLSDEQMDELYQSARRARPIRKAARVAGFNGWMTLLAGCITVVMGFGSTPTLVFGVLLGAIGTHELTLRRRLLRFEHKTTRKLAFNQIFLAAVLIAYAIFKVVQSSTSDGMISSAIADEQILSASPDAAKLVGDISKVERLVMMGVYAVLIVVAIVMQGSTAIYYLIKGFALARFRASTPDWVIRTHHAIQGPN